MRALLLGLLLLFQPLGQVPATREIVATWGANTEADLGGYKLHYGTGSGSYSQHLDVGKVLTKTVTVGEGTWYFVLSAYDTAGNESGYGPEASILVDATAPGVPGGLVLQVQGVP